MPNATATTTKTWIVTDEALWDESPTRSCEFSVIHESARKPRPLGDATGHLLCLEEAHDLQLECRDAPLEVEHRLARAQGDEDPALVHVSVAEVEDPGHGEDAPTLVGSRETDAVSHSGPEVLGELDTDDSLGSRQTEGTRRQEALDVDDPKMSYRIHPPHGHGTTGIAAHGEGRARHRRRAGRDLGQRIDSGLHLLPPHDGSRPLRRPDHLRRHDTSRRRVDQRTGLLVGQANNHVRLCPQGLLDEAHLQAGDQSRQEDDHPDTHTDTRDDEDGLQTSLPEKAQGDHPLEGHIFRLASSCRVLEKGTGPLPDDDPLHVPRHHEIALDETS